MSDLFDRVASRFERRFNTPPDVVVRAPGRVNLIGEHTDYNDGFVLPMAIDRSVTFAVRPSGTTSVRVLSLDFEEERVFDCAALEHREEGWLEYVKGTAWALQEAGRTLAGWEGVLAGDVPVGAGLSSSAALEVATARVFAAVSSLPWSPPEMARLAQKAENRWVGVNCGIMDQMISAAGKKDHALLIDCRSLETESVPLHVSCVVVILDTATRRGLVDSAYNERRAQCEAAARFFGVPALRDVSSDELRMRGQALDPLARKRARHVVTENERTLQAAAAMRKGDVEALGRLMDESHVSLRDDFEVSSPELDLIVELARNRPGCLGARMTGAGFGGCAVALVEASRAASFAADVARTYEERTHKRPSVYITRASEGASVVTNRSGA